MVLEDFLNTNTNEYKEILNIFEKARNRNTTGCKTNNHHIVPRHCFKKFGLKVDNSPENMIYLTLGEHCMVHYYYSLIGKEKWFINANRSSWQILMKCHIGEVYKECKTNIELMKLWCDTMDHKEYTCQSYERTDETRKKNGEANRGKRPTKEAKEKNRQAHLGKIIPSKRKKILQYSLDGEFIREWECISDAAKELGLYTSNISACCLGKKKSAYGFVWKYL